MTSIARITHAPSDSSLTGAQAEFIKQRMAKARTDEQRAAIFDPRTDTKTDWETVMDATDVTVDGEVVNAGEFVRSFRARHSIKPWAVRMVLANEYKGPWAHGPFPAVSPICFYFDRLHHEAMTRAIRQLIEKGLDVATFRQYEQLRPSAHISLS